jgi:hypothetical protein
MPRSASISQTTSACSGDLVDRGRHKERHLKTVGLGPWLIDSALVIPL